mgnify:FL=1
MEQRYDERRGKARTRSAIIVCYHITKQFHIHHVMSIKKNSCTATQKIYRFATAISILLFCVQCTHNKPIAHGTISDRQMTPSLTAIDISTVISDSGITRYRITTPKMLIFDKAERSNWLFPKGLHFERFNERYEADASVDCRWAIYYDIERRWILKDSVRCTNISGETFETNQLNWDEANQRIYSDSPIRITRSTMIINGIGFESNQMMTRYRINKITGVLPIDTDDSDDSNNDQ